jgi:hypothetical protein
MTRFLSEALEAAEPYFRRGLLDLEASNGYPSTDIRLSSEVHNLTANKLKELGLDPSDTTAEELYEVLKQKVRRDDQLLTKKLRTIAATNVSAEADPVAGMAEALNNLKDSKRCFALKTSKLKSLLKSAASKKAMKSLGYRSQVSMLKRENPSLILAAAWLGESHAWRKRFIEKYKDLKPSDFEERSISVLRPDSAKWKKLSEEIVEANRHNIMSFKELGVVVLLPLPADLPEGAITASTCLALHELNEIRACSTYLKLNQVKTDFGSSVLKIVANEPELASHLLDQAIPWNLIHRYYSRAAGRFKEEVFEPYVRLEDMVWHPVEKALSEIEPELAFWKNTGHLGIVSKGKPVSMNLVDSALNLCNLVPFEKRVAHYFKRSLWHELLLRYIKHEPVEQTILTELQPNLLEERVLA